jgi:DNA (cytosine-5)-methyltransferase 1
VTTKRRHPVPRGGRPTRRVRAIPRAEGAGKPPYRLPTMAAVREAPANGLTVASLFAGAGGSSLGYRLAGFRVAYANEWGAHPAAVYRANAAPGTVVDQRDVHEVSAADVLDAVEAATGRRELDVLDGSPPCQAFSSAGKRGGFKDPRGNLFAQYARLLGELRPRALVAENVAGMAAGAMKGAFTDAARRLREQGYRVEVRVLDAMWLGVPQRRGRLIFIGLRDDLPGPIPWPAPLPYRYSMRDALPWVWQHVAAGVQGDARNHGVEHLLQDSARHPSPTLTAWEPKAIKAGPRAGNPVGEGPGWIEAAAGSAEALAELDQTPVEDACIVLERRPPASPTWANTMPSGLTYSIDAPSPSIQTMGWGSVFFNQCLVEQRFADGRVERRRLTIPELKVLCSFPHDFALDGTFNQRWAALGNSVPPLLMLAVARELAGALA